VNSTNGNNNLTSTVKAREAPRESSLFPNYGKKAGPPTATNNHASTSSSEGSVYLEPTEEKKLDERTTENGFNIVPSASSSNANREDVDDEEDDYNGPRYNSPTLGKRVSRRTVNSNGGIIPIIPIASSSTSTAKAAAKENSNGPKNEPSIKKEKVQNKKEPASGSPMKGRAMKRTMKQSNKDKDSTKKARRDQSPPPSVYEENPVDPDEPTYCNCKQISYGEMIRCDNNSCQIEWFHFACVDLTTKPKGKWYCPKCRGDRYNIPRK